MFLLRQPLTRPLAVNLLGGVTVALVMLGGLMALNPGNLRGLIFGDRELAAARPRLWGQSARRLG